MFVHVWTSAHSSVLLGAENGFNDFGVVRRLSLGSSLTFYSGYKYRPQILSCRTRKFRDGNSKYWAKLGCRNGGERTF